MPCPSSTSASSSRVPKTAKSRSKGGRRPTRLRIRKKHSLTVPPPQAPVDSSCSQSISNTVLPVCRDPDAPKTDEEVNRYLIKNAYIPKAVDPILGAKFEKQLELERRYNDAMKRGVTRAADWDKPGSFVMAKIFVRVSHERRPIFAFRNFLHFNVEFMPMDTDIHVSSFIDMAEVNFSDESIPWAHWNPSNNLDNNGFVVRRHIRQTTAKVSIYTKESRFSTRPEFGRLIGLRYGTAQEIKDAVFIYAFRRKIIDYQSQAIICDAYLEKLTKKKVIFTATLMNDIFRQLEPRKPPLTLTYAIDEHLRNAKFFEISVPSAAVTSTLRSDVIENQTKLSSDIVAINARLTEIMVQLKESVAKKGFYEKIANDPWEFFSELPNMAVESTEDEVESRINPENYPTAYFANKDVMKPAIDQYLNNKLKQTTVELELNLAHLKLGK
uniref:SWIB domain-containing protein n=1 Tax=Panagrellus redivivus TaxID=6233 RepID=A0A7E4UXA0_PANRE